MKGFFIAVVAVAMAILAVSAAAAEKTGDWENVAGIRAGQKVEVVQTNMVKHTGKFVSADDTGITLLVDKADKTIPREQVARVSTPPSTGGRALLAVAGGFGGATAGGLIAHSVASHSHGFGVDILGMAVGGTAGALAGHYALRPRTYFRVRK